MREVLLLFHILGAAAWIGGGIYSWAGYTRLLRSDFAGGSIPTLDRVSQWYFGPAAGVTLISGVLLVFTQEAWGWGDGFVLIGLGAFLFSAIWQGLVGSKVEKRVAAAAEGGEDLDGAVAAFNRNATVDVAVLVIVVWAMVSKLGS